MYGSSRLVVVSDMGWPSECERDGFGRPPPDQGGKLVDTDVERVTGREQPAPIGRLLGGRVDRAGRGVVSVRFTVAPSRISTS